MTDLEAENERMAQVAENRRLLRLIGEDRGWALSRVQLAAEVEAENEVLLAVIGNLNADNAALRAANIKADFENAALRAELEQANERASDADADWHACMDTLGALRASLEEKERFAQEMYEWVAVALDAAGWKTVFDIPDWQERSKRLDAGEYNGTIASLSASLERMREALGELVRLKDGPRDAEYRAGKEPAWIAARAALAETETEQSVSEL